MDLRGTSCSMGPVTASPMGFGIPQDLIIKTEVTSPVPSPAPSPEQSSVEQNLDLSGMCAGKPLQHKMFENKDELTRALGVLTQDEKDFLGQVYYFAKDFKSRRVKLNFTQHDVGAAMGKRYGKEFSQTTISRFEALNLSFKLMQRLTPLMTEWLIETETAIAQGATVDQLVAREYEQPNPPAVLPLSFAEEETKKNEPRRLAANDS